MAILIFVIGLIIGSFISSLTWRIPKNISIAKGRSICPKCKKKINWYDNIPLFSYIILSGKCRNCKKKISVRYPLIELFTGILFLIIYLGFLNCSGSLFSSELCYWKGIIGNFTLPYFLIFASILFVILVIDFEKQYIPDGFSFLLIFLSFLLLILSDTNDFYLRLFVSFLPSLFLFLLYLITKGRGMGLGDVKLVLFGGMILDWKLVIIWMSLSFIIGAVVGLILIGLKKAKLGSKIPFAPFLIISFIMTLLWGNILTYIFIPYLL